MDFGDTLNELADLENRTDHGSPVPLDLDSGFYLC